MKMIVKSIFLSLMLIILSAVNASALFVHGPDLTGGYGELEGTGGIDAVVNDANGTATGIISDIYGHVEATATGGFLTGATVTWNSVRSTGYGPEPGTTMQPLDGIHDLSTLLAWRGKYVDGTGFILLGSRYYDPSSGTFLSADPLGHAASMDLYSAFNGDPVNSFDPDGRQGKNYVEFKAGQAVGIGSFAWDAVKGIPHLVATNSIFGLPEHLEESYYALRNPAAAFEQRKQAIISAYNSASQSIQSDLKTPYGQGKLTGYAETFILSLFSGAGEERTAVALDQVTARASAFQRMGAWRSSSGGSVLNPFAASNRPIWLQRVDAGNQFNQIRRPFYPYNEIRINTDGGDYVVLDSYDPVAGEIISRKFTQFADIQEQTGIGYVNELASKYAAGSPIASVPSSGTLAGQELVGDLILEVPAQIQPIPQSVLNAAKKANVTIRDVNGTIY
jgi:RHS repeat-associated protein